MEFKIGSAVVTVEGTKVCCSVNGVSKISVDSGSIESSFRMAMKHGRVAAVMDPDLEKAWSALKRAYDVLRSEGVTADQIVDHLERTVQEEIKTEVSNQKNPKRPVSVEDVNKIYASMILSTKRNGLKKTSMTINDGTSLWGKTFVNGKEPAYVIGFTFQNGKPKLFGYVVGLDESKYSDHGHLKKIIDLEPIDDDLFSVSKRKELSLKYNMKVIFLMKYLSGVYMKGKKEEKPLKDNSSSKEVIQKNDSNESPEESKVKPMTQEDRDELGKNLEHTGSRT